MSAVTGIHAQKGVIMPDHAAGAMGVAAVCARPTEYVIIDQLASFAAHPAAFCAVSARCTILHIIMADYPATTLKGIDCATDVVSSANDRISFYEPELFRAKVGEISP